MTKHILIIISSVLAVGFTRTGHAVVANLSACNITLARVTPSVIEESLHSPAVAAFVQKNVAQRYRLEAKKSRLEGEIQARSGQVFGQPLRPLLNKLRDVDTELIANRLTFETELFRRMSRSGGSKSHYIVRLTDFLEAYATQLDHIERALAALEILRQPLHVIETPLADEASLADRARHKFDVWKARRHFEQALALHRTDIEGVRDTVMNLAPVSGLNRALPEIDSTENLRSWVTAFESARLSFQSQHNVVSNRVGQIKLRAEEMVPREF